MNTLPLFARESNPQKLKQCPKCPEGQQWHPATPEFFSRNKNRDDGLQTLCKVCMSAYKKQYYQENKEEIKKKKKEYQEENRDLTRKQKKESAERNKEHIREYKKQYYEENKEQLLEEMKQYYQDNREQKIAYQRQYEETHREQVRETQRRYRERNKEHIYNQRKTRYRESIRNYHKMYYEMHRYEHSIRARWYRETHKERLLEQKRRYLRTERGRMVDRAHGHRRRAQKLAAGGTHTAKQLMQQKKNQRGKCYYCKAKLGKICHADHIVPLSRGGSDDISNIVLTCPDCNLRKGAKFPHEWTDGGRLL